MRHCERQHRVSAEMSYRRTGHSRVLNGVAAVLLSATVLGCEATR